MQILEQKDDFRDHIATVDEQGKGIWIYPKKPKGWFYNERTWVSLLFLMAFLVTPFIYVKGEPLMLFNIFERKFILFGVLFMPQDFYLFVLAMLTFLVFIALFTVVYGRVFCGWVCPQTIFMEMFFRKIEYWIEGDANEQRRLDKRDWDLDKMKKKVLKHTLFFLIAVVVANYFLAYIIGMEAVLKIMTEPLSMHVVGFVSMVGFSVVFYGVFARLREQVCTTICPYGRLQSVLIVPETIVIAYDFIRGEPRGKLKKQKEPLRKEPCTNGCPDCEECAAANNLVKNIENNIKEATNLTPSVFRPLETQNLSADKAGPKLETQTGDCIDCKLCVQVCPTGIDIRNGTQLECVNCTACIDACDEVMVKINKPKGLIRYDSLKGITEQKRQIWTPRVAAYSVVLVVLLGIDGFLFSRVKDIEVNIFRTSGQMYQVVDNQHIKNLYTYQITHKINGELPIEFKVKDDLGEIKLVGNMPPLMPSASSRQGVTLLKGKMSEGAFFIEMDKAKLTGMKTILYVEIYANGQLLDKVKTSFLGPMD
jgi:polyferredoxin